MRSAERRHSADLGDPEAKPYSMVPNVCILYIYIDIHMDIDMDMDLDMDIDMQVSLVMGGGTPN